jgi:hypothetical protein
MSDFLTQIASEYKIDSDELTEKWANFTGLPKKTVKTSDEPTVKDLRAKLRSHGLKVSGKKEELIDRLDKFDRGVLPDTVTLTGYEAMTVKQLKEKLRERGLTVGGKKAELIEKLHDSDNSSGDESEDEVHIETESHPLVFSHTSTECSLFFSQILLSVFSLSFNLFRGTDVFTESAFASTGKPWKAMFSHLNHLKWLSDFN